MPCGNTPREIEEYSRMASREDIPKDFNPVDDYFFRKYLVYKTNDALREVIKAVGHICSVCEGDFNINDEIIYAGCKDLFHWECLRQHLFLSTYCPRRHCTERSNMLSRLRISV